MDAEYPGWTKRKTVISAMKS